MDYVRVIALRDFALLFVVSPVDFEVDLQFATGCLLDLEGAIQGDYVLPDVDTLTGNRVTAGLKSLDEAVHTTEVSND